MLGEEDMIKDYVFLLLVFFSQDPNVSHEKNTNTDTLSLKLVKPLVSKHQVTLGKSFSLSQIEESS